jgi:hypothetical protein
MRLPAALLALLVVTAGCSALSESQPPSDQRALDVQNRTLTAAENVSTYRYTIDVHVSATDGTDSRAVGIDGHGVVDYRAEQAVANATTAGETRSVYVDGDTVYTECPSPWDGWGVENASEEIAWAELSPLGRQLSLLERTNVYYQGNRTLDGNRTILVVAHPSQQTLQSLPDTGSRSSVDFSDANVDNATFELWVDPQTDRPVRTELRIEVSSSDASGVAEIETRFRDWNEPASISIPDSTRTDQHEFGCPGA